MRRRLVAFGALTLVGLSVTGCAINRFAQREPWRAQAEEACLAAGLVTPSETVVPTAAMDGPGACGMTHPFRLTALAGGSVSLKQRMTLACPMIPQLDGWIADTIQPAAELYMGAAVVQVRSGSYSCRPRNNQVGAKASEHSYGNAVDVMSFKFADGREVTVKDGWRGSEAEQGFLREVFLGACQRFTTVLGPGSNAFHYDHFHVDLARHDPKGLRHYCRPVIKFDSRLPEPGAAASPIRQRPQWTPAPQQAPIDEEQDPFAVEEMSAREPASRPALAARPIPPRPPVASIGPGTYAAAPPPRPLPPVAYAGPTPAAPYEPALRAPVLSGGPIY